ncbi:hypothetical protein M885DRAFT_439816, partial [Pelagophyceae sp. CCMP2097]
EPGDRVLLCYAPGSAFFVAFWACLRAGVIAVPVYPPDPSKMAPALEKLRLVQAACGASLCLADSRVSLLRATTALAYNWPKGLSWRNTEALRSAPPLGDEAALDAAAGSDVAFLQFTSGSTGDPKGVIIDHSNLWHNINCIIIPTNRRGADLRGLPPEQRLTCVSWLPQYHDMGLIYSHVSPFVCGDAVVYMSPLTFIAQPELWLIAASKYRATYLASPDFGYRLVAKRVLSRGRGYFVGDRALDLSCIHGIETAAERVRTVTYEALFEALRPYGFDAMVVPAYGLAEHVVAASICARLDLVCVGTELLAVIKIVDVETCSEVALGATGEIWISSPSAARGYWGQPELSRSTFRAKLARDDGREYLRTGDEGFLERGGRLFVCGRLKDMIIVCGKNYYAEDAEVAAQEALPDALRPGCIAAFSVDDGNEEALVVVAEMRRAAEATAADVAKHARSAVGRALGLAPKRVVLVREKTIPKTTSGATPRSSSGNPSHVKTRAVGGIAEARCRRGGRRTRNGLGIVG